MNDVEDFRKKVAILEGCAEVARVTLPVWELTQGWRVGRGAP